MGIKKSIFISDKAEQFILDRCNDINEINLSETVSNSLLKLDFVYREVLKTVDLTTDQWLVIFDIYNGHYETSMDIGNYRIASDIMDHYGAIDVNKLEDRIKYTVIEVNGYSQLQQLAIIDVSKRFWARDWNYSGNHDEVIKKLTE